ncbi:hypothetical protein [Defluviicoccus vanus]|uniref:Uncharacterized protein n=1 Tax=Defluviicoccus vanus TaxID=111831 RepID=A0A7H1N4X1_9PROT|nr:hypothetical protein [Defluviicoccus vanus]QNT70757.1 hypothetical protein HQ394_17330 [Defluviicoccus vanus]
MTSARTAVALNVVLEEISPSTSRAPSVAADWHGFRLATINGSAIAAVAPANADYPAAPRLVAQGDPGANVEEDAATKTDDAAVAAFDPTLDGSLAWVGRLACWTSALLSVALIVLAVG